MPQIAVIADDLTGAADTGVTFARAGLSAMVALDPAQSPSADVLVVSTESRALAEPAAFAITEQITRSLQPTLDPGGWVYKKIDSTLRGHPRAELRAVMAAVGAPRALVAPAFPGQGRTTVAGRQLVDGQVLTETSFGAEVASADLAALFDSVPTADETIVIPLGVVRQGADAVRQVADASGAALLLGDAESDADLDVLASVALGWDVRVLCGSAGLAAALARQVRGRSQVPGPSLPTQPPGPVLVVAGSRHPASIRQVEIAARQGHTVARACQASMHADGGFETIVDAVALGLAAGQHVVLTSAGLADDGESTDTVARTLAYITQAVAARTPVGGLVLTGGDIAASVCRALEVTALWLQGEVQPGIPSGRLVGGPLAGLPVVTKAGGFGTDDALTAAIEHLAVKA